MALITCHAHKKASMESWLSVTGCTARSQRREYVVDMTLRTGQPGMCSGQWKLRERMVERGWQPAAGAVTGAAIRAELLFMSIILRMTGVTVTGRAFEDIIDMAT